MKEDKIKAPTADKQKLLKEAMADLQKKYGKGFISKLDDMKDIEVKYIPTGLMSLDYILGGGLAKGRIYEFSGMEGAGKSLLSMFLMATIQKNGGTVALLDAENAFNSDFAAKIGLDVSNLILSQETCLETVFETIETLVKTNALDLIVVDSVASLVPRSELEGVLQDKEKMAQVARLMSRGLRTLVGPISKSKTIVIFVNQLRDNLDLFSFQKTITPGGKALKFYSSVRLEVKKGEKFLDKDKAQIGNVMKIKIVKNKVGFPFRECDLSLYYDRGVDLIADIFEMGEKMGVLVKVGTTYMIEESGDNAVRREKIAVGKDATKEAIAKKPELQERIKEAVKNNELLLRAQPKMQDNKPEEVSEDEE